MKSDSTKAMQEALQAAVARLNGSGTDSPAGPEPFGTLLAVLPKLLQDNDSGEELLEKLESLQKGDLGPLRQQLQILRKQCHRILKSQEAILLELHEMKKQQATVSRAVLALARNMERIELIEGPSSGEEDVIGGNEGGMKRKAPRNPE